MSGGPTTLRAALEAGVATLIAAGFPAADARVDARVLARHVFGLDEAGLILREPEAPDPAGLPAFRAATARRARFEPVAYILGHREFYGREFAVSPAVLVPRPETEMIVEMALARFGGRLARRSVPREGGRAAERTGNAAETAACAKADEHIEIVDVGTGSGCIAVSLACELPCARIVATDVSATAIEIARANARRHGVGDRVAFQVVSLVPQVAQVDLVVSNPPYVPVPLRDCLPRDVRDHEPPLALFAGDEGLDLIRGLVGEAASVLRPGGWLIFEFGYGQADAVARLLRGHPGFDAIEIAPDLQGIPRVVAAQRTQGM